MLAGIRWPSAAAAMRPRRPPASMAVTALPRFRSHALPPQLLVHRGHHFRVHGRHDLAEPLQHGNLHPAAAEVLDHLQADVSAADDHRPVDGPAGHPLVDAVAVVQVAEGEHAGQVQARHGRANRYRPRRQHQGLVGLERLLLGVELPHHDRAGGPVDRSRLALRADLDAEPVAEPLRRGHQQLAAVFDHAAQVIRQTAIGERDRTAPLDDEDFGPLVQPAEPRSAGRPARHPAHDHNTLSHGVLLSALERARRQLIVAGTRRVPLIAAGTRRVPPAL